MVVCSGRCGDLGGVCHGLVRTDVGKGHWVLLWSLLVECPAATDRDMGASLGALFDVFRFTRLVF